MRTSRKHKLEPAINLNLVSGQRTPQKTRNLDGLAPKLAIRSCDAGQRLPCFDSGHLTIRTSINKFDKCCISYSRTSRERSPKMQRLSGRLQELNYRGSLPRRGPRTSTLWKIIYCMQSLSWDMCSSMLLLKFYVYSK